MQAKVPTTVRHKQKKKYIPSHKKTTHPAYFPSRKRKTKTHERIRGERKRRRRRNQVRAVRLGNERVGGVEIVQRETSAAGLGKGHGALGFRGRVCVGYSQDVGSIDVR